MMKLNGTYATVKDACAILKVTEGRVRQLLIAKRIEGIKIGREWLIPVINERIEIKAN